MKNLKNTPPFRLLKAKPVVLVLQTVLKWQRDDCFEMGAALSYYALFSLFPLFLVILSVFGALTGPTSQVYDQILFFAQNGLPPEAYTLVTDTLIHLNRNSVGAGIISFLLLFFTASGVFGALTRAMNKIWRTHPMEDSPTNLKTAVGTFLRNRMLAFLLVFSTTALMLVSLVSNIVIRVILDLITNLDGVMDFLQIDDLLLLRSLQASFTFVILSTVIMVMFKVLPSTPIRWGDVWLGGLVTTGLFMLLQHLVSNSIIRVGEQFRSYGVVGSVMILMLWLFLTCQVFLLGSEMTFVYAYMFGSRCGMPPPRTGFK
ncbi:YihY/virulence factor BrkB family protein [Leptolyngbya sp. PCC 6406]|uniref:YihY/virulence factor BrkB family protein n=1 Tax=Leptolyngbya sp. PCC 6406 TaxID=1173264 RepID=UPI0002ABFE03|nr:YihY/virulence factor BrkB family protein [Leptolyngbya sp. PCC 6406]